MEYLEKWDEFTRQPITNINTSIKDDRVYVMSGRTALNFIIRDILSRKTINSIYMPEYSSTSMISPIIEYNIRIFFYKVCFSSRLLIEFDENNEFDCVLLMDYFGFSSQSILEIAENQRSKGKIVIIDNTQTLLCKCDYSIYADYTFASYRKWYASNAAEIIMKESEPLIISNTNMNYESLRNELFSEILKGNNRNRIQMLNREISLVLESDYKNYIPSQSEIYYNQNVEREDIFKARRRNAQILLEGLKLIDSKRFDLMFKRIKTADCPLCIPIVLSASENRESFLRYLIANSIMCTYHWNLGPLHLQSSNQNSLFTHEVSLACDQRLTVSDIYYIIRMIIKWNQEKA